MTSNDVPYQYNYGYSDGDTIPQIWSPVFILFAFFTAFVASFSAVRLLHHTTWRTEKEKEHASRIVIKLPRLVAAFLLGFGTVWSMHFVGMATVSLKRIPMCYDWPFTLASLVSSILFIWAGVTIAEKDIFAGPNRIDTLKLIIVQKKEVTMKGKHKQANAAIHKVALFHRPWYIITGAVVAATGALIMHYTGMMALRGPFRKSWSIPFVASSTVLGIVVCLVGFWIIFRLLKWKVEQTWLRPVSAAVIAMAVCSLHFFAMLGVTYTYDASNVETCGHVVQIFEHDPNQWTTHQIVALAVALSVPSLALLIENMISRELFHAYRQLKNPALTVEYILKMACKSKDAEVRRLSDDFCDSVDWHDFHRKPRRARSHGDLNLMAHSSDLECGERSTSESLGL